FNDNERPRCMVIDTINGFAYFGTYTGLVVKVRLSDFTRVGTLALSQDQFLSAVADPVAGFAYFGTFGGSVHRLRLSDFSSAGVVSSGTNNLQSATIDTVNGYAYFGSLTSPGSIAKVRLSDFVTVDRLTLN